MTIKFWYVDRELWVQIQIEILDFPGGPVVGGPPDNMGDMGWIPGPGRFHMPWGI